ncbi:hypothetical protein ACQEU3_09745 [Spirillospora sp. CA-253888]
MTAVTAYRSTVSGARDGFGALLRAEWTKLRSVPRWGLALLAAVVLTIVPALLAAAGAGSSGGGGGGKPPPGPADIQDLGYFVNRPLADNGSVVARIAAQDKGKAGLMARSSMERGAPYAAVLLVGGRARFQSGYGDIDVAGPKDHRWVKLTRSGTSVTGHSSADGRTWRKVGTAKVSGSAVAGPVVAVAEDAKVERRFGSESIVSVPTQGSAVFDHVAMAPEPSAPWRSVDRTAGPAGPGGPGAQGGAGPPEGSGGNAPPGPPNGAAWRGGTLTVTASGDIGPYGFADDRTRMVLTGVLLGLAAVVAVAVLSMTSEYRRGMIRTTLAAVPRRGRMLLAKAAVLAAVTFAVGLVAAFGAFLLADLLMSGRAGPQLPPLTEGPVLRALVGTAALLAVVAVFALAVATVVRHSAAAITTVLLVLLLPYIVATGLPLSVARWLERLTPAAGFAIQDTVRRYDTAIAPWAGFGVLCAYTAVMLAAAAYLLRRRDA